MPQYLVPNTSSVYWLISFDKMGMERTGDGGTLLTERILAEARIQQPSNVFLFSHGWKGDLGAARNQYDRWIGAMTSLSADVARFGSDFRPLYIGLHWPSLPFGQENFEAESFGGDWVPLNEAQDRYIEFFDEPEADVRPLLQSIFDEQRVNAGAVRMPPAMASRYNELSAALGFQWSEDLDGAPDEDGVKFDPVAAFEVSEEAALNFGDNAVETGLLSPLRQLSFWTMKKRSRRVGEGGMHKFIGQLQDEFPHARFHLMGHSFGCIVVSGILGGPGGIGRLPRPVDSLVLVQGAVSLWAYADKIMGLPKTGYFNSMIRRPSVRGPIVTTRSRHDYAVGVLYPLAVGLTGQVSFDLKLLPPFGGIGTFGIQGLQSAGNLPMLRDLESNYSFTAGNVFNLEGSDFISGHCNISCPQVAHVLWQAALV
jgi:hypothetical protein